MRRTTLLLVSVAALQGGCRTRLPEPLPPPPDLSIPPDLALPPDFAPPPDLAPEPYCRPIYVIDSDTQDLSAFVPGIGMGAQVPHFEPVAHIQCPGSGRNTPATMSIDLRGFAWVLYTNGSLYKVNLIDPQHTCEATAFDPTHLNPDQADRSTWQTFGSSFSKNAVDTLDETLFVAMAGNPNTSPSIAPRLAAIDPTNFFFMPGPPTPTPIELTGTAAAELWMFLPSANSYIARLDKNTGAQDRRIEVPQITVAGNFAFSFWGGSFWIFNGDGPTRSSMSSTGDTSVYRVEVSANGSSMTTRVLYNTRRYVVGAGVSGCAPLGLDN